MEYDSLNRIAYFEDVSSSMEKGCIWYVLSMKEKEMGISRWLYGLERAACEKIADAQADLGAFYLYEMNEKIDLAPDLLLGAGEQGIGNAYYDLGIYYLTKEDFDKAIDIFKKAKILGEKVEGAIFSAKLKKCINTIFIQPAFAFSNGFDSDVTQNVLKTICTSFNEDYNEVRDDCLLGASVADNMGDLNAFFVSNNGIYTHLKSEKSFFVPWEVFIRGSLNHEYYATFSMKENVFLSENENNFIIIPYIKESQYIISELQKLQNNLKILFEEYNFI